MAFEQGGGGGKSPSITANTAHALAKPYELSGEMTPEKMSQLDEMLALLFESAKFSAADIVTLDAESGSGDVVGPSGATDGRIAEFDGTTGKLIADSGKLAADIVTGPSSAAADGNIALFNGTTGKILEDSGFSLTDLLSGAVGSFRIASTTLSTAEINASNTSPKIIAAAPGVNKIAIPIVLLLYSEVGVTNFSANPVWSVQYSGRNDNLTATMALGLTAANSSVLAWEQTLGWTPLSVSTFDPRNVAIVVKASADTTSGSGSVLAVLIYSILESIDI